MPQSAQRADVLVLRTDPLANAMLFHIYRLFGELLARHCFAFECVECVKKADGCGGRGSQAGARRQIADVMDLDAFMDVKKPQTLARGRMLDLVQMVDRLNDRVMNPYLMVGK